MVAVGCRLPVYVATDNHLRSIIDVNWMNAVTAPNICED